MNEELLIDYASQTLANQKLANLFTFKNSENIDIEKMVFEWNEILNEKNMYVEILNNNKSSAQIYAYRPHKLKYVLNETKTKTLLSKLGYNTNDHVKINHTKKSKCFVFKINRIYEILSLRIELSRLGTPFKQAFSELMLLQAFDVKTI